MESLREVFDFANYGFTNVGHTQTNGCVKLRTNVHTKEEFMRWKEVYEFKTNTCFNARRTLGVDTKTKIYSQLFRCHHGIKHKGIKKISTGCQAKMVVVIRRINKRSTDRDKLLPDCPCFVTLQGHHNHTTDSAEALNQLKVSTTTKETFERYFEQGMTTAQAARYHIMKLDLQNDLFSLSNSSINPSTRAIQHLRENWLRSKHGDLNDQSVIGALEKYGQNNPELTLEIDTQDNRTCIVLVTPFMKRVHIQLREAGEMVFVDAINHVGRVNCVVIPILCAGPAGAVPLAVLFTISQDEATLRKGFSMVKKALGSIAFCGRGAPQCFMTDNCDAVRNAIQTVWPSASQYLYIFQLLQQVWRWLSDVKHGIKKHDCQELMAITKTLANAQSKNEFEKIWEEFQVHPLSEIYPSVTRYMSLLNERRQEWALAYRGDALLCGHTTNIFCEATLCIIKDIVLNRCKAYNMSQLVVFMVEIFDVYMRQRLVDVALSHRQVRAVNAGKLPMDSVTFVTNGKYLVCSESDPAIQYEVDLIVGMCTCPKGETGAICKHQTTSAEYSMTVVPQMFVTTNKNRRWLASLAVGEAKTSDESLFKGFTNPEDEIMKTELEEEEGMSLTFISSTNQFAEDADSMDFVKIPNFLEVGYTDSSNIKTVIKEKTSDICEKLKGTTSVLGNEETIKALDRISEQMTKLKAPSQLNKLLFSMGAALSKGASG